MNFHNASFKAAYGTSEQLPASTGPEVSFAGRSNVGKSSLLNKLMYRKGLAKVSSTPGKTATINFYDVDGHDLVDLPGYGYAKVSKAEKGRWSELIEGYYNQDRDFALVVSLIDIRHEPSALDRNMVQFLMDAELPFAIALTKADKLSKQQQMKQRAAIKKALKLPGGVPMVVTSSEKGDGIDELRALINRAIERRAASLETRRKLRGVPQAESSSPMEQNMAGFPPRRAPQWRNRGAEERRGRRWPEQNVGPARR
ncbi:MAG: ribosome biogenesis GTP-binding protein YihA/YsxC [Coriobacteriaceae bacterium]